MRTVAGDAKVARFLNNLCLDTTRQALRTGVVLVKHSVQLLKPSDLTVAGSIAPVTGTPKSRW